MLPGACSEWRRDEAGKCGLGRFRGGGIGGAGAVRNSNAREQYLKRVSERAERYKYNVGVGDVEKMQ